MGGASLVESLCRCIRVALDDALGVLRPLAARHRPHDVAGGREEVRVAPAHCVELEHLEVELEVGHDERRDGGDRGAVELGAEGESVVYHVTRFEVPRPVLTSAS